MGSVRPADERAARRARAPAIVAPFLVAAATAFAACGPSLPPAGHEAAARDRQDDAGAEAGACPYGELADAHRGFVRCLERDEQDAGWLPPAPQDLDAGVDAADAPPDAGPTDAGLPAATVPPAVTISAPEYTAGEVPRVVKVLSDLSPKLAACVAEHGGLSRPTGSMKVQFLVRARGKAEGVEIEAARGVTEDAEECVRLLLKNRNVGAPTADPVGVVVTIDFKPGDPVAVPKAEPAGVDAGASDGGAEDAKPKPKKKKKKKKPQ